MTIVICLDEQRGMMFNGRRQSRDRVLIADLVAYADGRRIVLSPYSAPLFENTGAALLVSDKPCDAAADGDVCFLELPPEKAALRRARRLIIYRWNKRYPADVRLDADLSAFRLLETTAFEGTSHEKITREVFTK